VTSSSGYCWSSRRAVPCVPPRLTACRDNRHRPAALVATPHRQRSRCRGKVLLLERAFICTRDAEYRRAAHGATSQAIPDGVSPRLLPTMWTPSARRSKPARGGGTAKAVHRQAPTGRSCWTRKAPQLTAEEARHSSTPCEEAVPQSRQWASLHRRCRTCRPTSGTSLKSRASSR